MRGTQVEGRFKIPYENMSIDEGIVDELRTPVGSEVEWYVWDETALQANYTDWVDPIYDVSNSTPNKGIRWNPPFTLPVIMAQNLRGTNVMNERGLYVVDSLRLVVAVDDIQRLIPSMETNPNAHIQDRILFQGEVFVPTRVLPRGRYRDYYAVVTIDCNLVNGEELVNFQQFLDYAHILDESTGTAPTFPGQQFGGGGYGN